jgi:hypothetical protein
MQKTIPSLTLASAIVTGAFAPVAFADTMAPVAGGAATTELTGTVAVVNTESRLMTLETPSGKFEVLHVPPEVKRIDEIKIGDKVTISETEAVLVDIDKGGSAGSMGSELKQDVERAPGSEKPAGTLVDTLKIYGKVEAVDKAASKVTVRGPNETVTLSVKNAALLDDLAPGDGVVATYIRVISGMVE